MVPGGRQGGTQEPFSSVAQKAYYAQKLGTEVEGLEGKVGSLIDQFSDADDIRQCSWGRRILGLSVPGRNWQRYGDRRRSTACTDAVKIRNKNDDDTRRKGE